MFSPLNNDSLDAWFQRLNVPLKRLPVEERVQLHQEVRQHLEALAAANEELGSTPQEAWEHALTQFGEPSKFGRRMVWEWRRKHGFIGPQAAAVLYGVGVCSVSMLAVAWINWLVSWWLVSALPYFVEILTINSNPFPCMAFGFFGAPIVTGLAVGWKYPHHALRGTLHGSGIWPLLPAFALLLDCLQPCLVGSQHINWPIFITICCAFPGWLLLMCGAAYLASVTKRGWYRPTLNDFKITLPKRRQVG